MLMLESANSLFVKVSSVHSKEFIPRDLSGKATSFFHVGMSILLNEPPRHTSVNDDIGRFNTFMLAGYSMLTADNDWTGTPSIFKFNLV